MEVVGKYTDKFNTLTGQALPIGPIYQSSGLALHVQNHHPDCMDLVSQIPQIISSPDYVGQNKKEPNSIELVKRLAGNAMVCIKLDSKNGYLYVASAFRISEGKLNNRINSGRLKKY